jgi:hypothetical protein
MNFKSEFPDYKFSRLKSSATHRTQTPYMLIPLANSVTGVIAKHLKTNNF